MSFVFYDTETTGTDTAFDQILQFAAIRTDADLNELERFNVRCRLSNRIVPSPGAMKVTGVEAQQLSDASLPSHYEMILLIKDKLLSWSPSTFIGYNSINFDEHLFRQALYKILHDPYLTNKNGNNRTDALRLVQAASIFASDALHFPNDEKGRSVFRLDRVAPANGFDHAAAHDALGDVEATIFLCRLLAQRCPELWSNFMRFSQKSAVLDYISDESVFCLSDVYFGRAYSWLVTPIGSNPENESEIYVYDLSIDPEDLFSLSDAKLVSRLARSPKPIRRIRANACPTIMSADEAPLRIVLPQPILEQRATFLSEDKTFRARLIACAEESREVREESPYVEKQIYGGFYSNTDQSLLEQFHRAEWNQRIQLLDQFDDRRLQILGQILIYEERPELLDDDVRHQLDIATAKRLLGLDGDVPWLTLPRAIDQIDDMLTDEDAGVRKILADHRSALLDRLQAASSLLDGEMAVIVLREPQIDSI